MGLNRIFDQIHDNLETIISQNTPLGIFLWKEFLKIHPADIAKFLSNIEREEANKLFLILPQDLKLEIFPQLSYSLQAYFLSFMSESDRSFILSSLPIDELTDFFDELSDEELKKYLPLLHKKDREKVLSLMQFNPESAGGIMDTNVITLMQDFTVEKSIIILQRLQPKRDLHRNIYVTNRENELVGYINIEDLVLRNPKARLFSILRKIQLLVKSDEDQKEVAQKMVHYNLLTVPVVDNENIFLGVIPSDTLIDVIEQEAASDVYRISALAPIKNTYFETPFFDLLYQRSFILVGLFLIQILSSLIIRHYSATLAGFLFLFINTITSTGGNTSSQTSALIIQGLHSGEISETNINRFLKREFNMAAIIALLLAVVSYIRIYLTNPGYPLANLAISISLAIIVLASSTIGSLIPFILKKLNLDPALSAGPFLATLMDVLGLLIYCYVSQLIVG